MKLLLFAIQKTQAFEKLLKERFEEEPAYQVRCSGAGGAPNTTADQNSTKISYSCSGQFGVQIPPGKFVPRKKSSMQCVPQRVEI